MALSLSRVTSAWSYSLAQLPSPPEGRLEVLLRVCVGDGAARAKDAGDVLQRALPLTAFLDKVHGQHADRVVPALVQLLGELPAVWGAVQNGPLQTQADFTQLLLELRRAVRSDSTPRPQRDALSRAVQQLIQQLFLTAVAQQLRQPTAWLKSGCNLLLRALTRSPQFVSDPGLPLLPADAFATLRWLNDNALGAQAAAAAAAGGDAAGPGSDSGSGASPASSARLGAGSASSSASGSGQPLPQPSAAAVLDRTTTGELPSGSGQLQANHAAGKLLLKDDKVYLLLTKLILTATGAPAAAAGAATLPALAPAAAGPAAGASAAGQPAGAAAPAQAVANGDEPRAAAGVTWANGVAAGAAHASSIQDPALLCQLLEWSSTKVKLAMQQLLEPSGSHDVAPSREATTASAQMAATCIHILQAGPELPPHLEAQLRRQVEQLLETALAVGEAAAAAAAPAAAEAQAAARLQHSADADMVLALGARILASTTPFVAAAVRRGSPGEHLALTSRLQQLLFAAARLAARQGVSTPLQRPGHHGVSLGGAGAPADAGGAANGPGEGPGHVVSLAHMEAAFGNAAEHEAAFWSAQQATAAAAAAAAAQQRRELSHPLLRPGLTAKGLRAGMQRLATRRAAKPKPRHHHQHAKGSGSNAAAWQRLGRSVHGLHGGGMVGPDGMAAQPSGPPGLLDSGLGLGEDLPRQLLLADAEPVVVVPEDLAHPWSWDVTQPLTTLSGGVQLSRLPLSTGIGGFLLARAAAEMLCQALAAAWSVGSPAPVRRLMLLPHGGPTGATPERVVTALTMGRLYAALAADAALGRLLLPLLADLLSSSATGSAGGAGGSASLGGALGSISGSAGAGPLGAAVEAATGRGGADEAARAGLALPAEVAGAVVCSLEGMASACVQHSASDTWLYDQALQLLLMLYREPTPLSLQLMAGRAAPASTKGLLADALHLLAVGLEDAPQRARQHLCLKLLLLFSDVAARVGGSSCVVTADLGDLLVAVAVAAEGLQPRTLRLLGASASSNRLSIHDIQSAQREDASATRLFRSLWLYSAMHRLVHPAAATAGAAAASAGAAAAAGGSSDAGAGVVREWQLGAGRLAAVTPLLVVGTDSYHEADMVERLKVELGEQLSQAGSLGSASSLSTTLITLLGGRVALEGLALPQLPGEAVLQAFVVAVALAELSRAALAPLPDLDDDPVVACPVSISLGYLKGVLPDGVAAAWVGAIVRRAAKLYTARLLALAARQEREEEEEGAADAASLGGLPAAPALAYAEQYACALIAHLAGGGLGSGTVTQGTAAPTVAALADGLLSQLLVAFPALYQSQPCMAALLVQLQHEEGDVPMGQVKAMHQGRVWERTKAWVESAAEVAPMATEALLHSFLTSSDSLPGATSPGWIGDEEGAAAEAGLGTLPVPGGRQAHIATQKAAFRRAADLLQACNAARRLQPGAAAGDGAYEGALGLTRKLHYTGYVQGLMKSRSGGSSHSNGMAAPEQQLLQLAPQAAPAQRALPQPSAASVGNGGASLARLESLRGVQLEPAEDDSVSEDARSVTSEASAATRIAAAEEIATQLQDVLNQPNLSESKLAVAQLSATALLAVQPDEFSYSRLGMQLLRVLARAPLRHLTPETMRLSQFSWSWVCVESPEVLVPLLAALSNAWIWTIDQRLGLFSGSAAVAALAAAGSDCGVAAGGAEGEDAAPSHDEAMLQAISAHFLWLSHLQETWQVVSRLRDGRTAAARVVYGRLLAASLQAPEVLSHHPAAVGAYFRLLTLALVYARSCLVAGVAGAGAAGQDVLLLFDRILRAALLWFRSPPRYFARCTRQAAAEQLAALEVFMTELARTQQMGLGQRAHGPGRRDASWPGYSSAAALAASEGEGSRAAELAAELPHPVWGVAAPDLRGYIQLLQLMCKEELTRLRVWTDPLKFADAAAAPPQAPWRDLVPLAWQVDPCLALSLQDHFPGAADVRAALERLVVKHASEAQTQCLPKAAMLLSTAPDSSARDRLLPYLAVWAPGTAAQGLELLAGPAGGQPAVRAYAIKCLFNEKPEKLVFFLPQLVQLLRGDADGSITRFFLTAAAGSDLFGHQLIWALSSEAKPPEEAFNPEVKRSGWQPPKDTGLWDIAARVRGQIEAQMTDAQREYWAGEGGYFDQVTALSGYLYKFPKDERRAKLQEALAQFGPPRPDLYLPTNPEARVRRHIPSSGACMQSAAKVPILVAFEVELPGPPGSPRKEAATGSSAGAGAAAAAAAAAPSRMACIFKVGDDIRQDVLAIQVIRLLHDAFEAAGLNLYLRPYGCLPTGYECGIIEVVPNTRSRAALGELSDRGLHDIFTAEFGAPGSPAFEAARANFIVSEAAYAVASYLLQAKDRHNGNIMVDEDGHIVHIDFGFILEISPGGNLGFESAAFKLSHEMTQVLDPGGRRTSPQLALFEELVIRAYLAARTVAEPIIAAVSLMADSGLPCFSRGAPVANLRRRFHLDMSDAQAAAFMRAQITDAYDKWTTGFYDYIQSLQNKIPY